jgi:nitrogen fixation/metabolism regulation signal transduction histidine kinase
MPRCSSRSTQTIIIQVQAMKRMVNDFSDYARMPAPELAPQSTSTP